MQLVLLCWELSDIFQNTFLCISWKITITSYNTKWINVKCDHLPNSSHTIQCLHSNKSHRTSSKQKNEDVVHWIQWYYKDWQSLFSLFYLPLIPCKNKSQNSFEITIPVWFPHSRCLCYCSLADHRLNKRVMHQLSKQKYVPTSVVLKYLYSLRQAKMKTIQAD